LLSFVDTGGGERPQAKTAIREASEQDEEMEEEQDNVDE
jgi:hypothetical protein